MSVQRSATYRWLPDDTEESILGAEWHQDAISSLCNGLRDVARQSGWAWHVGNQLTLVAWHPDGSAWRPKPDIIVHLQAGATPREEMNAHTDGLPALIVEVASPSTYTSDVNVNPPTGQKPDAKGYEYLAWPLPEYLVFDPMGAHLQGQVRAWRIVEGQLQAWLPDTTGHYQSRTLGVAFRPEGRFLRIFDPAGQPVPLDHEQQDIRERLARRAEQAEQELAALRALLERRGGQAGEAGA